MSGMKVTMDIRCEATAPVASSDDNGLMHWQNVGQRLSQAYTSARDIEFGQDEVEITQWRSVCERLSSLYVWAPGADAGSDTLSDLEEGDWELDRFNGSDAGEDDVEEPDVTKWGDICKRMSSPQIWDASSSDDESTSDCESDYRSGLLSQDSTCLDETSDLEELDSLSRVDVAASVVLTVLTLVSSRQGPMSLGEAIDLEDEVAPFSSGMSEEVDLAQWDEICHRMASSKIWDVVSESDSDSDYLKETSELDSTSAGESSDWEVESLSAASSL